MKADVFDPTLNIMVQPAGRKPQLCIICVGLYASGLFFEPFAASLSPLHGLFKCCKAKMSAPAFNCHELFCRCHYRSDDSKSNSSSVKVGSAGGQIIKGYCISCYNFPFLKSIQSWKESPVSWIFLLFFSLPTGIEQINITHRQRNCELIWNPSTFSGFNRLGNK